MYDVCPSRIVAVRKFMLQINTSRATEWVERMVAPWSVFGFLRSCKSPQFICLLSVKECCFALANVWQCLRSMAASCLHCIERDQDGLSSTLLKLGGENSSLDRQHRHFYPCSTRKARSGHYWASPSYMLEHTVRTVLEPRAHCVQQAIFHFHQIPACTFVI